MTEPFQRFTAPDPVAHAQAIARTRSAMSKARAEGDSLAEIDHAGELASVLTTARQEAEARELLASLQPAVREHLSAEPAGWFYLALGTASQYLGLREEALPCSPRHCVSRARVPG